ncbi:MAG: hypothetical protein H6Q73_114 [Firmicutes bacterium]|nr:hypothetical protein [Bacillota bacterium]
MMRHQRLVLKLILIIGAKKNMLKNFLRIIVVLIVIVALGTADKVSAQASYVLIQSDEASNFYIDTSRMQLFSKSKFRDGWVKKVFIDNGKERSSELDKKSKTKRDKKAKPKENKNLSYQLVHVQFDPASFKYKVLEIYSFEESGQMIATDVQQAAWMNICPGSIEEKMLTTMNQYIEQNIDMIVIR